MKNLFKFSLLPFILFFMTQSCSGSTATSGESAKTPAAQPQTATTPETKVEIETSLGTIVIKLYNETPLHRDNFIKLVNEGFYSGVLFHRVIKDFMIQTGDPDSKTAKPGQQLGVGGVGYTIPAEFVYPKYFHKKGALAAARTGDNINPKKESSGSQFYIVTGNVYTDEQLNQMEASKINTIQQSIFQRKVGENMTLIQQYQAENNQSGLSELQNKLIAEVQAESATLPPFKFTAEERQAYKTTGGAPFLDGEYSVFGEVVSGMDIVDKISQAKTSAGDRPEADIKILSTKVVK